MRPTRDPSDRDPERWSAPPAPGGGLGDLLLRALSPLAFLFPFETAELVLPGPGTAVRILRHRPDRGGEPASDVGHRADYSSALWSSGAPARVLDTRDLDASCAADSRLLEAEFRSVAVAPFALRAGEGLLLLAGRSPFVFDESRAAHFAAVTSFLGLAADHEQLRALDEARHARRAKLESIFPAITESLDIRKVFPTLSQTIREVVPHDVLAFALLAPDRSGVRVQAAFGDGVLQLPEYRFSNSEEALDANWPYLLAYDLTPLDNHSVRARISPRGAELREVVVRPGPAWMRFVVGAGIRSTLRVPIRAKDRTIGGVAFLSSSADAYDEEDGIVGSRIADHVALALAYQDLAEEERRIALAEERARQLEGRVVALSRELDRFSAHRALGVSPAWKKALADATQVAGTDTTVLVTGESGTGKEVIARFIHRGSKRAQGTFVALNCAALPEQLLESELFGHERGAFTGAVDARAGKIEQASGGVLFLDEVGEMSTAVQAKFLRVLQEREFQRLGGSKTIKADVRIVAATNRDPKASIAAGTLREDLYYRLGVFEIHLPPLRERPEDILVLAEAFLHEIGEGIGCPAAGLSEDAREQLLVHAWPGNVRELRNAIERAVILCRGGLVTREHLPIAVARPVGERVAIATSSSGDFPVEGVALDSVEKDLLTKALAKAGNNKSKAAKLLGVSRGQLYSLMRRHGLTDARR